MRYRRMVLLVKGRTERGGGDAFPRRLFAFSQGRESPPLRSHGDVENAGMSGWVAKGHPRPFGDPGRPISRYGYDYEKYGNSALKDVK